jgi:hypothetical protein
MILLTIVNGGDQLDVHVSYASLFAFLAFAAAWIPSVITFQLTPFISFLLIFWPYALLNDIFFPLLDARLQGKFKERIF